MTEFLIRGCSGIITFLATKTQCVVKRDFGLKLFGKSIELPLTKNLGIY